MPEGNASRAHSTTLTVILALASSSATIARHDPTVTSHGCYIDTYVRRNGEWKFVRV